METLSTLMNNEFFILWLDAIFFFIFLATTLYILFFIIFSKKKRSDEYPKAIKKSRFCILISLNYNNEDILDTIKNLIKISYPRDMYDIYIIPSTVVTDTTIQKIENLSAKIIVPTYKETITKAKSIEYAVNYLIDSGIDYDACVILEPGDTIDENFLMKVNDAYCCGCVAIQTHRITKYIKTAEDELVSISEEINNAIFRKGHTNIGLSSALMKAGMVFDIEILRKYINTTNSRTFEKQLEESFLKTRIYIEYLDEVYTYNSLNYKKDGSLHRKEQVSRKFKFSAKSMFLPIALLNNNWDYSDKLIQWLLPSRFLLILFIILFSVMSSLNDWTMSIKWWALLIILIITFISAIPDYLVNNKLFKSILLFPFIILKIVILKAYHIFIK